MWKRAAWSCRKKRKRRNLSKPIEISSFAWKWPFKVIQWIHESVGNTTSLSMAKDGSPPGPNDFFKLPRSARLGDGRVPWNGSTRFNPSKFTGF